MMQYHCRHCPATFASKAEEANHKCEFDPDRTPEMPNIGPLPYAWDDPEEFDD